MEYLVYAAPISGIVALFFAYGLASWVSRLGPGTDRMKTIASLIRVGSLAFLKREYKTMVVFIAVMVAVLGIVIDWLTAVNYLIGAFSSLLAGYFGMLSATKANGRTANAAREVGISQAFKVALRGGAVMGLCVVGLGLIGIGSLYIILGVDKISVIIGFSLGASSMALFGRVGGGIYTKAAELGAKLVGNEDDELPLDDSRNAAVIADYVGDNVGGVTGTGADLFESYVGAIVAAVILALTSTTMDPTAGAVFPLVFAAIGTLASVIGVMIVRGKENTKPSTALNRGTYVSCAIVIASAFVLSMIFFRTFDNAFAIVSGLAAGIAIGKFTEIFTSGSFKSVRKIAAQCEAGPANAIISGFGSGLLSTVWPVIFIVGCIVAAYHFAGLYGIALAAVGMLSMTGMVVAIEAYSAIADNAGGIADLAHLPKQVRAITGRLDAIGSTTAAVGKGFAIGSGALTALALLLAYAQVVALKFIDLLNPLVIGGLFLGAMLPFLFSALTMNAVGKVSVELIEEVRRQFKENPAIRDGTAKPDYAGCVDVSTNAALKAMMVPGLLAFASPIAVGLVMGIESLGGLLAGATFTGVLLAIMIANAGAAWENTKKYIEEGHHGGKGSNAHAAAIIGDAVGDPFKDTAGPAISILIKLMTIVALVFAPLFLAFGGVL